MRRRVLLSLGMIAILGVAGFYFALGLTTPPPGVTEGYLYLPGTDAESTDIDFVGEREHPLDRLRRWLRW